MNGLEIRQWLCEDLVGRFDLINTDGTNNGADKYTTAGQRFLDRLFDFPRGFASHFSQVAADSWNVKFANNRTIKDVYANNTEGRSRLEKKQRSWLMQKYTATVSATDSGTPLYWAPAELRSVGSASKNNLGEFFRFIVPDDANYNGIVFLPPTDEALVIEVYGQFYTDFFVDDEDETWWSLQHPEMLVWASAYVLEISYRNRQGANDWLDSILTHARQLDMDTVGTEIAQKNQIEG